MRTKDWIRRALVVALTLAGASLAGLACVAADQESPSRRLRRNSTRRLRRSSSKR